MCGFAGFINIAQDLSEGEMTARAIAMADVMRHRGPDHGQVWVDEKAGVALAHRRLSIIDLSPEGHQPMHSSGGRWVISYNGEIYNFLDIKAELEAGGQAPAWRGHSDTEVLLAAVSHWGVEKTLRRCNGMFALALWDRKERELWLARDRMGKKPLYYGWAGRSFVFASELKAIRTCPEFKASIWPDAAALFLRHGWIPSPHCIYEGFNKLPAGQFLHLKQTSRISHPQPKPYWSMQEAAARSLANPLMGSDAEILDRIEALLGDAVRIRLISDVPLGTMLSGGVDSSLITSLMCQQARGRVKTFSIGFGQASHNEAAHAKAVAGHLGTDHTELYLEAADALKVVPLLPDLYDEPFADSSQIPTHLVSKLARQEVVVGISGDGGDEVFAGYARYQWGQRLDRLKAALPRSLSQAMGKGLAMLPTRVWAALFAGANRVLPQKWQKHNPADNLSRMAGALAATDHAQTCRALMTHWDNPTRLALGAREQPTIFDQPLPPGLNGHLPRTMQYLDTVGYLCDDILTKVDRAAMGVSLEVRSPLLDYRLLELSWRLPFEFLQKDGLGKWPLRQILYRHVPKRLLDRPKAGFGVPLAHWLRMDLREWAGDLLSPQRLKDQGLLNPAPIEQCWQEHQRGIRDWHHHLWDVLMLQSWIDAQERPPRAVPGLELSGR
jgi:asparagine synthase (glutamine-hydrolysing)